MNIWERLRGLVDLLTGRESTMPGPPGMVEHGQSGAEFQAIIRAGGFTCHACGLARPDGLISVMSEWINGMQYNRRYCVDRPGCGKVVAAQLDETRREATR